MLGSGPCGRIQDQSLSSVSHAPRGCCLLAAPCARKVAALLPLPQLSTMSEGWVDCPTLGPGWKRREAYRRSGATCGRTDTYYQGPNGEKFRSKIELTRFLGPSQDLTNFDFKNGVLRDPPPKVKKAQKRCLSLSEPEPPVLPEQPPPKQQPVKPEPPEQPPPPLPERRPRKRPAPLLEPQESAQDAVVACCASCQNYFPGVMLPSQRRCRWLCPDCRAQRRDFNREQRFFKRVGCGACQACQIPEDCGICTVCAVRAKNPELRIGRKCLLRRCLKIVKKGFGCGVCQGCQATEDCGSCYICLRRLKPGLKRQWKCLKRRCLKKKQKSVVAKKAGYGPRKLTLDGPQLAPGRRRRSLPAPGPSADGLASKSRRRKRLTPATAATKWKPSLERDPGGLSGSRRRKQLGKITEKKKPGRPPKHPSARARSSLLCSKSRRNRKCGECEACLLKADCGRCDFCRDKPKFGGDNLKRQKCRWRQCLRFAMVGALPTQLAGSGCSGRAGARCRALSRKGLEPYPRLAWLQLGSCVAGARPGWRGSSWAPAWQGRGSPRLAWLRLGSGGAGARPGWRGSGRAPKMHHGSGARIPLWQLEQAQCPGEGRQSPLMGGTCLLPSTRPSSVPRIRGASSLAARIQPSRRARLVAWSPQAGRPRRAGAGPGRARVCPQRVRLPPRRVLGAQSFRGHQCRPWRLRSSPAGAGAVCQGRAQSQRLCPEGACETGRLGSLFSSGRAVGAGG
ncbi:methyl-CpG-binding domain protein 1 isoform X3 [Gopherus evgoodei]|uniref:methyl-CpG-binding domain protein 1 isoform X3 n=1 Tax=Gopherus evgoodei TaxID=1825980 RepID=UPI0011CFABC2|nr:methyl-CpG-binding domain protein 1 isoform X3 [Gopherus evgoodei]